MMMALAAFSLLAVSCGKEKKVESQAVKVKTMEAAATSLYGGQSYSGTIEEDNGVSLSFPVGGTLKQMNIAEGQNVGAGQLIAVLDATTLGNLSAASQAGVAQAEALLSQAEQSAALARDAYKRMKLWVSGSNPDGITFQTKSGEAYLKCFAAFLFVSAVADVYF
jgi:multidrug efflux pump subunit AcrA (membrane-fusion protein)